MSQLTAEQIDGLARQFFSVAKVLTDYREHHWDHLTAEQHRRLGKMQWSLYNYSDDLLALSAVLAFEEAEENINRIEHITKSVNQYIKEEDDVSKVIDIAARVVVLGGAVISQSPLAIVSTLAELATCLR